MVKELHFYIVVREFEPQSRYYVHFWIITFEKAMKTNILHSYEFKSTNIVILQGWL